MRFWSIAASARRYRTYFAFQPEAFAGRVVGSGECVDFAKVVAGAPHTAAP